MGFRGLTSLGSYQLLENFSRIVAELTNRHELAFSPIRGKQHIAFCSSRDALPPSRTSESHPTTHTVQTKNF